MALEQVKERAATAGKSWFPAWQLALAFGQEQFMCWPATWKSDSVRWHKRPRGEEEALPGTSLQRGHGGPCSPWVDSCGQLAQGKCYRPGAARRGRVLLQALCMPERLQMLGVPSQACWCCLHVYQHLWGPEGAAWATMGFNLSPPHLSISLNSQNFPGSQLQKSVPEPLAEIRK